MTQHDYIDIVISLYNYVYITGYSCNQYMKIYILYNTDLTTDCHARALKDSLEVLQNPKIPESHHS